MDIKVLLKVAAYIGFWWFFLKLNKSSNDEELPLEKNEYDGNLMHTHESSTIVLDAAYNQVEGKTVTGTYDDSAASSPITFRNVKFLSFGAYTSYEPVNDSLLDITSHPAIESAIDNFALEQIPFLSRYKNPCWFEAVNLSSVYTDSIYAHTKAYDHYRKNFDTMRDVLDARLKSNKNGGLGGKMTWMLRCLPYFYLVGVSRCGSTDLAHLINQHPHVTTGVEKEFKYWNRYRLNHTGMEYMPNPGFGPNVTRQFSKFPRKFQSYVEVFDSQAEKIRTNPIIKNHSSFHHLLIGDYTPSYMWDFDGWRNLLLNKDLIEPVYTVADYIKMTTPQAKIIIILRNPVDRLYSDFNKFPVKGDRTRALFHGLSYAGIVAFKQCLQNGTLRGCVYDYRNDLTSKPVRIRVGLYYPFIEEWMRKFPGQIFLTRLEVYSAGRTELLKKVFKFLELEPLNDKVLEAFERSPKKNTGEGNVKRTIPPMWHVTRCMLEDFYRPYNRKLGTMLNDSQFWWF